MSSKERQSRQPVIIASYLVDEEFEQAARLHVEEFDSNNSQRKVRPRKGFGEVSLLPPNFLAKHVALMISGDDPSRLKYNPDGSISVLNNPRG